MPELPEVERARTLLEQVGKGNIISEIVTFEDSIVFANTTHEEFAQALKGKKCLEVKRKGKNFYMLLDSPPPHPVFHLGMTGSTQVGGQAALIYRAPRASNNPQVWPPKYTKIVMTFSDENSGEAIAEWAFSDSRRLARIRLIDAVDPETLPPLSLLGRDPHLDMISVEELSEKLKKRKAPIKAIMLDQNGPVCGIGNWMIDEILYQARLHPSHTGALLTEEEIGRLHHWIKQVTEIGVQANADHRLFPDDWLFSLRWSKGKKGKKAITVDGTVHEITFCTVGGRTSAVVESLQILPEAVEQAINDKLALTARRKAEKGETSSGPSKAKGKGKRKAVDVDSEVDSDEGESYAESNDDETKPATSPYFGKSKPKESSSSSTTFTLPDTLVSPSKSVKLTTKKTTRKVVKIVKKVVVAKVTKRKSKRVSKTEDSE